MSRKHNVKKTGGTSRYPDRLEARGMSSATVRMPFIDRNGRSFDTIEAATRRRSEDVDAG